MHRNNLPHIFEISAQKLEKIKKSKKPLQYDSFSKLSKEFVDEIHFRAMHALVALDLFDSYLKKKTDKYDHKIIVHIAFHYAISEIATLIDGSGRLSMKLSKNQKGAYTLDKNRLRKLLPSLTQNNFIKIYNKISKLITDNNRLVERILYTRHNRIAHAGISSHELNPEVLVYYYSPTKNLRRFADKLESLAYELIFGIKIF